MTKPLPTAGSGPEAGHLAGRIACLAEFMTADRYAVLRRTVAVPDALYDGAGREHVPRPERRRAGAPLRGVRHSGDAHGRKSLSVRAECGRRARDRPVGRHPAASFDGRRAGGAPRRGLPHRRHDAPPRGLHPRDVRRRAGALRAGLRHGARRDFGRGRSPRRTSSCASRCAGWSRA